MRQPRCAEPTPGTASGGLTTWMACNQPVPCLDHPHGKMDTTLAAFATWLEEQVKQ